MVSAVVTLMSVRACVCVCVCSSNENSRRSSRAQSVESRRRRSSAVSCQLRHAGGHRRSADVTSGPPAMTSLPAAASRRARRAATGRRSRCPASRSAASTRWTLTTRRPVLRRIWKFIVHSVRIRRSLGCFYEAWWSTARFTRPWKPHERFSMTWS